MTSQTLANETAQPTYLEILAYLGMTRHLGAWTATNELSALCHIEKGKYILDVGCGTGKTSSAFAKRRGCHVVGIDLSPRMIEWAKETAQREGVTYFALFEDGKPASGAAGTTMIQHVRGKLFDANGLWAVATARGAMAIAVGL